MNDKLDSFFYRLTQETSPQSPSHNNNKFLPPSHRTSSLSPRTASLSPSESSLPEYSTFAQRISQVEKLGVSSPHPPPPSSSSVAAKIGSHHSHVNTTHNALSPQSQHLSSYTQSSSNSHAVVAHSLHHTLPVQSSSSGTAQEAWGGKEVCMTFFENTIFGCIQTSV